MYNIYILFYVELKILLFCFDLLIVLSFGCFIMLFYHIASEVFVFDFLECFSGCCWVVAST